MVRKTQLLTAEERETADDAVFHGQSPDVIPLGDADSELAWDEWIGALKDSATAGTIRAHRLPVDADGNPLLGKGTRQIFLGSWPHQLYGFDDLLAKLTKEFLKPGEIAHVKLTGTAPGVRGVMFSRVVTLQKADGPVDAAHGTSETVGQLFKVMQDGQQQQLAVLREIMGPSNQPVPQGRSMMEVMKDIAVIVTPILGPALAAYIGRPAVPRSDLAELVGVMSQLKDFMSGDSGKEESDSTTVGIIKAVAPALPQLLQLLNQQSRAPSPMPMPVTAPASKPLQDLSRPTQMPPPPPPAANLSTPTSQVNDAMLAQLKPQLDQLVQLAEQNTDPVEVAKLTVQMLPEQFEDTLAHLVADQESFSRLSVLSPDIKKHSDWFERLRLALHSELYEPDETAST